MKIERGLRLEYEPASSLSGNIVIESDTIEGTARSPQGMWYATVDAVAKLHDPLRIEANDSSASDRKFSARSPQLMPVIRQIAQLGHAVLRAPVASVKFPASDSIKSLVTDMLETLRDANGVGIAAPQVFESVAVFIVASRPNPRYPDAPLMEPEIVINPEIVERSPEIVKDWEGCLSIPGLRGEVPRHRHIRARYQTIDGQVVERPFSDFVARIFQHEDDHLRGIVFLDRLESTRDVITEKEFQKLMAK